MKTVILGEVASVRSSLVDPTDDKFADLPHVAPDTVERDTGRLLEYSSVSKSGVTSGKYQFEAGDILYSKIRPTLNKVAHVDFAGLCSADMYAVVADSDKLCSRYLVQLLRSPFFVAYTVRLSNRANIPKLNREQLLAFRFPLPPLPEQRRIAAILDHADVLRAKRRHVVAHLDNLAQSIFLECFGEHLEASTVPLGELALVSSGITKGRRTSEPTKPVPYLAVSNVQAGSLNLDAVKEIDATAGEIKKYALEDGDLVLTEGGDPDKLGRGTVWRNELPLSLHQNHIFRVRVHPDARLKPDYLSAYMASRPARAYFLRAAKQTTGIASINMTQLKNLPVFVPPPGKQDEYLRRVGVAKTHAATMLKQASDLDALFTSLQSRAFRGEL